MSSGSNAAWLAFTFDVLRAAAVCFCFCGGDSVRAFVFQHILAFASFVLLVCQVLRYSGRAMASWPLSVVLAVHEAPCSGIIFWSSITSFTLAKRCEKHYSWFAWR